MKKILFLIGIILILFVNNVNAQNYKLECSPQILTESGYTTIMFNESIHDFNGDIYLGFNSNNCKPKKVWIYKDNNLIHSLSPLFKYYEYDNFNLWYYLENIPIEKNSKYKAIVYFDINMNTEGKYAIAIKPHNLNFHEARNSGYLLYLDPWWNTTYPYKQELCINNTVGEELNDFTLNITIHYNANMKPDFSDLRFINNSDNSSLSFWIEDKVYSDYINVWINFTYIPAFTWCNDTYYMYYGNQYAENISNGYTTFPYFNNFENYAIDSDINGQDGWSVNTGYDKIFVNNTKYRTIEGNRSLGNVEKSAQKAIRSLQYSSPFIVGVYNYIPPNEVVHLQIYNSSASEWNVALKSYPITDGIFYSIDSLPTFTESSTFYTNSEWNKYEITCKNNSKYSAFFNNIPIIEDTSFSTSEILNSFMFYSGRLQGINYIDDIYVRKYTIYEPKITLNESIKQYKIEEETPIKYVELSYEKDENWIIIYNLKNNYTNISLNNVKQNKSILNDNISFVNLEPNTYYLISYEKNESIEYGLINTNKSYMKYNFILILIVFTCMVIGRKYILMYFISSLISIFLMIENLNQNNFVFILGSILLFITSTELFKFQPK